MTSLVPTGADALTLREQVRAARGQAAVQIAGLTAAIQAAQTELEERRRALEAEIRARKAEIETQLAPLREQMAKLTEVAWTADLYLGRDEEIDCLREGAPAPVDTPLTIRQRVLVMAEESLILMDGGDTGVDYTSIGAWADWLLADSANLDRVLPEPKGVVVLVPTRVPSSSGNPWEDAAVNAANSQAHWLIRNGERLYLMSTDPELRVGSRVLPLRTEFVDVFDQKVFGRKVRVEPGSAQWQDLEKKADARRRHYMRIMLVLQGLLDRTEVFHPLPAGGVNLLSVHAQDSGRVILVADGEDSLLLTDGREPFRQWQKRLNALLRPGLRVVGDFRSRTYDGETRITPSSCWSSPASNVPHLIEGRRDGGFVIRFQRTDKVLRRNVPVPYRPGWVYREQYAPAVRRASFWVKPSDTFILPLDLAELDDLRYYLNSRADRSASFLSMVPTIRAAIAVKEAEAEHETDFRALLAGMLTQEGSEQPEADTERLIHWWKVAHTWARPLHGDPKHEAQAAAAIIRQYRRLKAVSDQAGQMVALGRSVPGCIAVARNSTGHWFAYSPTSDVFDAGVYLDITRLHKDGRTEIVETERLLSRRSVAALQVAWSDPAWETWLFDANPRHYLTRAEREEVVAQLRDLACAQGARLACIVEKHDPARPSERFAAAYSWTPKAGQSPAVQADSSPLGWQSRNDAGELVVVVRRSITKGRTGITLTPRYARHLPSHFDHYTGGWRDTGTPWWPADARPYAGHPRLVLGVDDVLDEIVAYTQACKAAAMKHRDERRAKQSKIDALVSKVTGAVEDILVEQHRARFFEDYGDQAAALWPSARERVKIKRPGWVRELDRHLRDAPERFRLADVMADVAGFDADLFGGIEIAP